MEVTVKIVVFKHSNPEKWDIYASYCPATRNYCCKGKTVEEVVGKFEKMLLEDLRNRLAYRNMKIWGWKVDENSAIPPIFADEELVTQTNWIFETTIVEPQIIEVNVELPRPEKTI